MKKLICLLLLLIGTFAFAEETILYTSDTSASCSDYTFKDNFVITSNSGYFNDSNLKIGNPTDKGLPFIAMDVPEFTTTHYDILVPYETFLNDPNTGAGYIDNAKDIKSISITATTNRPYDEIILMYKTTPTGEVKYIKMPQDFDAIQSMVEFTLVFDNPLYKDISKRTLKASPVVGNEAEGIYLVGFRIKTNMPTSTQAYSPYSVLYIKSVSVIYDKAFTDEQTLLNNEVKSLFEIDEYNNLREKEIRKIEESKRLKDEELSKMDNAASTPEVSEK